MTLPGQTYAPGLNTPGYSGNLGTPNPVTAGDVISPAVVRPVDAFFNMVGGTHFVGASSGDGYFELPAFPDNNFTVTNATNIDLVMRTHGNRSLTVTSSGSMAGTSDHLQVAPAAYARLAVVAPGEDLAPGIFDSIEDDGKLGAPTLQDAGIPFGVSVVATDAYWNPIGESDPALPITLDFSSSDTVADLPTDGQQLAASTGGYTVTLRTLADPNFQTVLADDRNSAASAFTAVPLQAGVIDHFTLGINSRSNPTANDPLDPIPDFAAGQTLNDLTVVARDQFGNHIPTFDGTAVLEVSHGDGILSPLGIDFSDGGSWPGSELGVWRGGLQVYRAGEEILLTVTDEAYTRSGESNLFDVLPGAYADLLVLLPGETHTPG
ncbi:MAG: maleylacetate reductase, partial [bacterium]|nr:maleylacetate reductase [bacterium]